MNPILKFAIIALTNYLVVPFAGYVDPTLLQSVVVAAVVVIYSEVLRKPVEVVLYTADKNKEESE
jgi:hypothetical protein